MEKKIFTTYEVSKFCSVDLSTVINWIDGGKLLAYKTPGGHRRVKREDLVHFLKEYKMPIPPDLVKGEKRKILIVDDDRAVIDLIVRAMKKLKKKCEVDTAVDGFEAGRKLIAFQPDLVILDLMLPGIDGFKICKNIRMDRKTKHVKVLAITGFDSPENRNRIFSSGANDYLAKPLELNELLEHIEKLLP
jgi:excisionase family DNA binding protein